jgi:hypothetical protein
MFRPALPFFIGAKLPRPHPHAKADGCARPGSLCGFGEPEEKTPGGLKKLDGTIGDITFSKSRDGYLARQKTSISAERLATDPAFQRTRENGAEFSRAGKAAKLLRQAFRAVAQNCSDRRLGARLTREMMRVIKADATSVRGMRNVIDGETELLQGFEFNRQSPLSTTLFAQIMATIDRPTGAATVQLAYYVPQQHVAVPTGATHYRLVAVCAEIDFEGSQFEVDTQQTAPLPWTGVPTAPLNMALALPAASIHPLFLAFGISFLQEVNGTEYALNNGAFNALSMVSVNGG